MPTYTSAVTPQLGEASWYDATAGALTPALPTLASMPAGRSLVLRKVDATTNTVTFTPAPGDLIDSGASTIVLAKQKQEITLFVEQVGGVKAWHVEPTRPAPSTGGTQLTVDGTPVTEYDIDPTLPTAADLGVYTQQQVDQAISAAIAGVVGLKKLGTSMWDYGNIETTPRAPGFNDKSLGSGTAWFQFFYAPTNSGAINRLNYATRSTAPAGITLARMGIYTADANDNITLAARTASFTPSGTYADQLQALATAGGYPATYSFEAGKRYALALLLVGTTPGNAHGWDIPGAGTKPLLSRRATGQSDLAASYTAGQLAGHYEGLYLNGITATG